MLREEEAGNRTRKPPGVIPAITRRGTLTSREENRLLFPLRQA